MYTRKRIYILVKTYPTISEKYTELVCTAGLLESGEWIRLYPVPFRILKDDQKYRKYSWINVEIERNTSDYRIESYRPKLDSLIIESDSKKKARKVDWEARKKIIFHNQKIYTDLQELIDEAKSDKKSLAIFKPTAVIGMKVEETTREWDYKKLRSLEMHRTQLDMFKSIDDLEREFKEVEKIPYKFKYSIKDEKGKQSSMMIEDWEIGALYRNCLRYHNNDEQAAIEDVKNKYIGEFSKRDLYLILGTTKEFHNIAPNPFIIIGVLPFPHDETTEKQISLFDV